MDVGDDHTGFASDQFRTDIIRMCSQAGGISSQAAGMHQVRSKIAAKTIVSHGQFIELPASAHILIVKNGDGVLAVEQSQLRQQFLFDGGGYLFASGKEFGQCLGGGKSPCFRR